MLEGFGNNGLTQSRWEALLRYWDAVCRHGSSGPICSLHPWDEWVLPDLHGFFKMFFDSLDFLKDFTKQVVVSRREAGGAKVDQLASGCFGFQGHILGFGRILCPVSLS